MPSDIGVFVGRYLKALGWLSIAGTILRAILFEALFIDLSFILYFWAGNHLIKHNPTARKWVIGMAGLVMVVLLGLTMHAAVAGTHGITLTVGRKTREPSLFEVELIGAILFALAGIPFVLLLTPQAGREFASAAVAAVHAHSVEDRPRPQEPPLPEEPFPTNCPACGAAITPEHARCPDCRIALR